MTQIALVGAGIAGLNAALILQEAGLSCTFYEASNRIGGRMSLNKDSILSQEETQGWVCFVDNRHDRLSSLRRIPWFIPGLIMVFQTAFKCAPIVLTRFRNGHRGTTPIGAKTARLDQSNLDTRSRDLA